MMHRTILILAVALLAGCGGGMSNDQAREILMKSDAVRQLAPRIYVPEGNVVRTVAETGATPRAISMGWVRCTRIDVVRVDCRLTSLGRSLSRDWTYDKGPQYPGWWVPAGSVDVNRIRVDQVSDTTLEVMFFARKVNDELGEKFGRKQSSEGTPYAATMQKSGEEWTVVGLRELVRVGG
jgi:hypothetical protein